MKDQLLIASKNMRSLSAIFSAVSGDEDTFLWSLADLLTLLLIFFIFLYAQSSAESLSNISTSNNANASSTGLSAPLVPAIPSQGTSPPVEPFSISPIIVAPVTDVHPTEGSEESPSPPSSDKVIPEHLDAHQKMINGDDAPPQGSMECLRQEALNTIDEPEKSACTIRWNQNRLVFVLGERFTFPVGEARLLADFQPTLDRIAQLIAIKKEYRVMVSGHTDDTPISTPEFPSNWELSAARAITVAKSLIQSGVDPTRLTIKGHGEFHPLYENSSPQNKEANRRVEIVLFMEKDRDQNLKAVY